MKQHEDFARTHTWRAAHQPIRFDRVQRGRLGGVGEQQHLVGVAAATLRPGGRRRIGDQQHVVGLGLDRVDQQRDAAVVAGIRAVAAGKAVLLQREVDRRRIDDADPGNLRQLGFEPRREARHIDARRDRHQRDRDGLLQRRANLITAQAPDDLARERNREQRAALEQPGERGLGQAHEHRVADRQHRGQAGFVGVQADLADDLAARDLAHHALPAFVIGHAGTQAPADRDVHRAAGVVLSHQCVAAGDLDPFEVLAQQTDSPGIGIAEQGDDVVFEQPVLMRCGPGTVKRGGS